MLKLIFTVFFLCVCSTFGYFTLPGKCPENVQLQTEFRLADVSIVFLTIYLKLIAQLNKFIAFLCSMGVFFIWPNK